MTRPSSPTNPSTSSLITNKWNILTFILIITICSLPDLRRHELIIDVQAIKTDLTMNVHNQTDALNIIFTALDQMLNDENSKVVNFVGGMGVGKTFIADILKKHFHSVQELAKPLNLDVNAKIVEKMTDSFKRYHLIVAEDLKVSDVDDVLNFFTVIPKDLVVFVIFIFNIQETDNDLNYVINYKHIDTIIEKFHGEQIGHKIAEFHEFSKEQASIWVTRQLIAKGVKSELHPDIIDSILVQQNIKQHGLKRLSSKMDSTLSHVQPQYW